MARVALVKLFTGLNLGVSQLSGELRRAGHETALVYFKYFLFIRKAEAHRYLVTDYALTVIDARGEEFQANCYTPFSETEYRLRDSRVLARQEDAIAAQVIDDVCVSAGVITESGQARSLDVEPVDRTPVMADRVATAFRRASSSLLAYSARRAATLIAGRLGIVPSAT